MAATSAFKAVLEEYRTDETSQFLRARRYLASNFRPVARADARIHAGANVVSMADFYTEVDRLAPY